MFSLKTALMIVLQIILQNCTGVVKRPRICYIKSDENIDDIFPVLQAILPCQPLIDAEYFHLRSEELEDKYDVIIFNKYITDNLSYIKEFLTEEGFLIYSGSINEVEKMGLNVIFGCTTDKSNVFLCRPYSISSISDKVIKISNIDFGWVENIKILLKENTREPIYLYTEGEELSGILGLFKCISTEEPNFRIIMIDDENCKFDIENKFFRNQLTKNLTVNVLRNSKWGTFVHVPFEYEEKAEVTDAAVNIATPGDLSSLNWLQLPAKEFR